MKLSGMKVQGGEGSWLTFVRPQPSKVGPKTVASRGVRVTDMTGMDANFVKRTKLLNGL